MPSGAQRPEGKKSLLSRSASGRKTLASTERACSRMSIVQLANGPKRSMGHFLGAKKIIFFIRDIDGPAMAAALAESCQSVILRSPWGRLETIVDMCNRLRRTRGRFHR